MTDLRERLSGTPWVTLTAVMPDGNPLQVNLDGCWTMLRLQGSQEEGFTRVMGPGVAAVAMPSMKPNSPPMLPHSIYGYVDVKETPEEIFALRYPGRN